MVHVQRSGMKVRVVIMLGAVTTPDSQDGKVISEHPLKENH